MNDNYLSLCPHVMKLSRLTYKIYCTDTIHTKMYHYMYPSHHTSLNPYQKQQMADYVSSSDLLHFLDRQVWDKKVTEIPFPYKNLGILVMARRR